MSSFPRAGAATTSALSWRCDPDQGAPALGVRGAVPCVVPHLQRYFDLPTDNYIVMVAVKVMSVMASGEFLEWMP